MLTLNNDCLASVTAVPDLFLEQYMPAANGEFVKVYLYLLKLVKDHQQDSTLSSMADFFSLHGKRYRPCAEILGEAGTPLALLHRRGKRSDRNRLSAVCPEGRKRNPSNTGILDFRPDCGCTGCFCCIR